VSTFTPNVAAITLFIADRERSQAFYARAFDDEPIFEDDNSVVFRLENLVLNLLVRSSAFELIEPAAVADPGSGSPSSSPSRSTTRTRLARRSRPAALPCSTAR
jgi:hypothetical protein